MLDVAEERQDEPQSARSTRRRRSTMPPPHSGTPLCDARASPGDEGRAHES